MTGRRIAGWAILALIPTVLVVLAIAAGLLPEIAAGVGIAACCLLAGYVGVRLLDGKGRQS